MTRNCVEILQRLFAGREQPLRTAESAAPAPSLVIVAAHPDDEVIGAGAQLPRWPHAHVVQVTNGAPGDGRDAHEAGFSSRQAYAQARQCELEAALKLAGIAPRQLHALGFVDQESAFQLEAVSRAVEAVLEELQPEAVLTQPYEGGHPDHDATAFGVHAACRSLEQRTGRSPVILEMTSYHNRAGIMGTCEFLPRSGCDELRVALSPAQQDFKRRLFECFRTQQKVLQWFPTETEAFRLAPAYDFTEAPHEGRLYYEQFEWGITGERWRELAEEAVLNLGLVACV